jgi:hypothetical protein
MYRVRSGWCKIFQEAAFEGRHCSEWECYRAPALDREWHPSLACSLASREEMLVLLGLKLLDMVFDFFCQRLSVIYGNFLGSKFQPVEM